MTGVAVAQDAVAEATLEQVELHPQHLVRGFDAGDGLGVGGQRHGAQRSKQDMQGTQGTQLEHASGFPRQSG